MGGAPLLLALAVVSIDYGYQPDGAGGLEYIIQIPPQQILQGNEVQSVIPPEIRGKVSRVIVRMGKGTLPRDDGGLLGRSSTSGPVMPSTVPTNEIRPPSLSSAEVKPPDETMADQNPMPIPSMSLAPSSTTNQNSVGSRPNSLRSEPSISIPTIDTDSATSVKRPQNNDLSSSSGLTLPDSNVGSSATQYGTTPQSNYSTGSTMTLPSTSAAAIPSTGAYSSSSNDRGWDPNTNRPMPSTTPNSYSNDYNKNLTGAGTYSNSNFANNGTQPSTGSFTQLNSTPAYNTSPSYNTNPSYNSGSSFSSTPTYNATSNNALNGYGNSNYPLTQYGNDSRPTYPNSYGNSVNDFLHYDGGTRTRDNTVPYSPLVTNNASNLSYNNATLSNMTAANGSSTNYGQLPTSTQIPYAQPVTPAYSQASAAASLDPILPDGVSRLSRQPFSHRFLDGILLFSLIVNVYLIIAISRLISRHRDLVASVRGSVIPV